MENKSYSMPTTTSTITTTSTTTTTTTTTATTTTTTTTIYTYTNVHGVHPGPHSLLRFLRLKCNWKCLCSISCAQLTALKTADMKASLPLHLSIVATLVSGDTATTFGML